MEMTPITVTEITGIEIQKVKVILIGAEDGTIVEVRDIVIGEEGEDGILISNTMTQGTNNQPSLQTRIIIAHHHQYRYPIPYEQYSYPQQQQYRLKCCQPHHSKLQISVNCVKVKAIMIINANLQVIFMACTQKAFNQGRSYNHQDPTQGEWSNGDTDNNDPNGQPFQ